MKKISKLMGLAAFAALIMMSILLTGCGGLDISGTYKLDYETKSSSAYGAQTYELRLVYDCKLMLNSDKTYSYTVDLKIYLPGVDAVKVHNVSVWEGNSYSAKEAEKGVYTVTFSDYTRIVNNDEDSEDYTDSGKQDFINQNKYPSDRTLTINIDDKSISDSGLIA